MSALYRVNFQMANNEDLRQAFAVTNSTQAPVDLTGADLRMDVETAHKTDALVLSIANGRIVVTAPASGQFQLVVPASTMSTLADGVYQHDLLLQQSGTLRRLWTGTLNLSRGVTE